MDTTTLRHNHEFQRVYRRGRFVGGRLLSLHYLIRKGQKDIRLGVTAGSKVRGSVRRNRVKRLLRESYRVIQPALGTACDLILVGKASDVPPKMQDVADELERLVRRAGLTGPGRRCEDECRSGSTIAGAAPEDCRGAP